MTEQRPTAETRFASQLDFLAAWDPGPRPPGWALTPRAVIRFICGTDGETLVLPEPVEGLPNRLCIDAKFVGERGLVERSVITLAGRRGLLLVGEPGTAKSMLSELLTAAISRTSTLTIQGSAGTTEEQLRYSWNYALLIAKGPHPEALVPSPVLNAMFAGQVVRIEEITRCLPEVQDALVSILSERRLAIPELGEDRAAQPGFNLIATANLRDKGVSEMSSALKRRFNFETVPPIAHLQDEVALVKRQATESLQSSGAPLPVDDAVLGALVTVFRDLRSGRTVEGWAVERPGTVMSTAEAVSVASSMGLDATWLVRERDPLTTLPGYLLGVVLKDDAEDRARLLGYWDSAVRRRAEGSDLWRTLYDLREVLEATQ